MAQTAITDYKAAQIPVGKHVMCFNCQCSPSKYSCKECSSGLCEGCRSIHNERFESDNHTVMDIRDESTVVYCMTHQGQEYNKFCTECSELLCEKCMVTDHNDHQTSTITSVADNMRQTGEEYVKLLNEKVVKISEHLSCLRSKKLPFYEKEIQRMYAEIDVAGQTICDILKSKQNMKRTELDDFKTNHDYKIASYLREKDSTLVDMTNLQMRLDNVLAERHDASFIISYENLNKDFTQIEQELFEEFNKPEVPNINLKELILDLLQSINTELDGKNKANLEELQLQFSTVTKEKEELQLQLKEMAIRCTDQDLTKQSLEDRIKELERSNEELDILSLNELNVVGMRERKIDVLENRVDNLQKEKIESNKCLADINARMQDWQFKSKQMTKEMELLAPKRFGSENEMNQHNIDCQENHLDSNLSAAKVDSETVEIKQSEQLYDTPELAYSSAEESKEAIKNLHINTNDVLRKIETKNSKDEKEPIDLWLRNKCTKGVSKDENYIQLHQLSTDEFQGDERGTGITKNDEGDTDEVLNFSEETTKAEIGDQMQSIVYLRNAENTNVENSENSKKRKKPESKKSEDGEDPHLLKGVGKDETNIQLQQLNTDVFQGDETGTGITNNDEGDTNEVFVSEETEKKEIDDEKGGIFPLTNTGKNEVRSLPISDDFGELPIKERIKLMERKRFLKKYNSE